MDKCRYQGDNVWIACSQAGGILPLWRQRKVCVCYAKHVLRYSQSVSGDALLRHVNSSANKLLQPKVSYHIMTEPDTTRIKKLETNTNWLLTAELFGSVTLLHVVDGVPNARPSWRASQKFGVVS
jgi:protein involved in polysaccharide export with SLBB domain